MFDMTMYTVPENNRTVQLCIDIGVELLEPVIFNITTAQKSPAEAEGKNRLVPYLILTYNFTIMLYTLYTEADYTSGTTITVNPGPTACIHFTNLVVDDSLAYEGVEAFAIYINGTAEVATVTILDDDGKFISYPCYVYL